MKHNNNHLRIVKLEFRELSSYGNDDVDIYKKGLSRKNNPSNLNKKLKKHHLKVIKND